MISEIDISNKMKFIHGKSITTGKVMGKLLLFNKKNVLKVEENGYRTEEIKASGDVFGDGTYIIVADNLSLSEVTSFNSNTEKILGIVLCAEKSPRYLNAFARSFKIPLLVITDIISDEYDDREAIMDSERELLIIAPDIVELDLAATSAQTADGIKQQQRSEAMLRVVERNAVLYEDLVFLSQAEKQKNSYIGGISFLCGDFYTLGEPISMLSEEQLFAIYKKAVQSVTGKTTIISVVSSKNDIILQENKLTGQIFRKRQLRALCRASVYGSIIVIFPSITTYAELCEYKKTFIDVRNELRYECVPFDEDMQTGITVQIPAALMACGDFADEADLIIVKSDELYRNSYGEEFDYHMITSPEKENLQPLLRMLCVADEAVHSKKKQIGIDGCLALSTFFDDKQFYVCADVLFVSPLDIPD